MNKFKIIEESFVGMRLDKFLSSKLDTLSRSHIQKCLKKGDILVNAKIEKAKYLIQLNDEIYIKNIDLKNEEVLSEDLDIDIVYEDNSCLVINKSPGMIVYPGGPGQQFTGTVANAIKNKVGDDFKDNIRLGIVHRLDKDTSGLIIIAKNQSSMDFLSKQFKNREVEKHYTTLVWGIPLHPEGKIQAPIGRNIKDRKKMMITSERDGKMAISKYKVIDTFELENDKKCTLLDVKIETGRTHQIRVHMASIGHVVVGDSAYGDRNVNKLFKEKYKLKRQFLHASQLSFVSPDNNQKVNLKVNLYKDLDNVIDNF